MRTIPSFSSIQHQLLPFSFVSFKKRLKRRRTVGGREQCPRPNSRRILNPGSLSVGGSQFLDAVIRGPRRLGGRTKSAQCVTSRLYISDSGRWGSLNEGRIRKNICPCAGFKWVRTALSTQNLSLGDLLGIIESVLVQLHKRGGGLNSLSPLPRM